MAAISLPLPGSEYGPCEDESCGHRDCEATRKMAAQPCDICGQSMGTRMFFANTTWTVYEHATCTREIR